MRTGILKGLGQWAGGLGDAMSLINQMLQDLDARKAPQTNGGVLPSAVRPLPPAAPSARWPAYLILVGVLSAALGVGGWYYVTQRETAPPALPQPVAPIAAPAPLSGAEPSPGGNVSAAVVVPAVVPAAVDVPAERLELGESLRLSDQLGRQSAAKAATKTAKTGSDSPGPGTARATTEERVPRAAPAELATSNPERAPGQARQAAVRQGGAASIERQDVLPAPRDRAEALYRKAIAEVNQGRVADGSEMLREALKQDPMHVPARQLLVRLVLELRQTEAAMTLLENGLEILPAQIGWAMSLARLQAERGDYTAAWKTLQHSEPAAAGNADYQGFAGHVLLRLGKSREAAEHFRHALRSSPADGRWWLGLGLAFEADGRVDEAREAWQTARRSTNLMPDLQRLVEQKLK